MAEKPENKWTNQAKRDIADNESCMAAKPENKWTNQAKPAKQNWLYKQNIIWEKKFDNHKSVK